MKPKLNFNKKRPKAGRTRALAVAPRSAFLAWFEQQAGKPRLNETDYLKLMHETVPQLRAKLASAERELAEEDRYRTAKQYALYAWCAKDTQNGLHERPAIPPLRGKTVIFGQHHLLYPETYEGK